MKKIAISILSTLFVTVLIHAQTPRAFEQAAAVALEQHDYYAAFKYYGKVLEMEPKRTDILVRYADAARMYGAYRDAEVHYEQALSADNAAGGKYHSALLGLALVKKNLGKYEEALRLFERYAARPDNDPELGKKATAEIEECEWAMEKITNPDKLVQLEPLDAQFNTGDSEMGMLQVGDTLYFGALHQVEWGDKHLPARPLLQVMMSVHGKKPVLAAFNKAKMHTALPTFSPDGRLMVVPIGEYVGETEVRCHLYWAKMINGQWSEFQPLPAVVNVAGTTQTQPSLASTGDGYYNLYFISDAPGGKGGKDIWMSKCSASGSFAPPQNLSAINTLADEATPNFDALTQSLYFSSTGYQNLGGYDIYTSKWAKNAWQTPKHLPSPLNSSYNDLYYAPNGQQKAVLTSNRIGAAILGEESCCYDLFSVTYLGLRLQLSALEAGTDAALDEVAYTLLEAQNAPNLKFAPTAKPVSYTIHREQMYTVLASKDGYFADTIQISSLDLEPSRTELEGKLYLRPKAVDLAVKVFNQWSKEPLNGASVFLLEQSGSLKESHVLGAASHESGLKAEYLRSYLIIAQKEGFAPDTVEVTAKEMSKPGTKVIKNLYLTPATLSGLLPLAIYFDNDVPPRSAQDNAEPYSVVFGKYMARKEEFMQSFAKNITNEAEKQAALARLEQFFSNEVKGGFDKLEYFADNLDLFLMGGYEVELMVKGFASPLASEEYNLALTRRRIVSVKNYLRTAKGGVYAAYILNGQLLISTAPLGETQSVKGINDNGRQREQSIFSPEASRERRAEIIEVRLRRL